MTLTSPQNPLLQKLRRAVETGRPLENGGLAAEGPHLLQEALLSVWHVDHIFCSSDGAARHAELLAAAGRRRIDITEVSERAFASLSGTEQNQGVLSLLRPRTFGWEELLRSPGPLVILDGIQDPGNAGAIVRSVEAFGGAGVAFTEGCVRVSNGKLLRATAGSIFRLPFLENLPRPEIVRQLRSAARELFWLSPAGGLSLFQTAFKPRFAVVIGSEGKGVSPLLAKAAQPLSIPTQQVESLNAAIACSVTLFEAARQAAYQVHA